LGINIFGSGPSLRTVQNANDMYSFAAHDVDDEIWEGRENQLPSSCSSTMATEQRIGEQLRGSVVNGPDEARRVQRSSNK